MTRHRDDPNDPADDHEEHFRLDPGLTRIDPSAYLAPGAVVLGDVHIGPRSSIWFGVVIRGDTEAIRIGHGTNLQDGTIVHADPGYPTRIGDRVTIGHRCIVHGAVVEDGALIGMGAILMNGSVIGAGSLVGAGALIAEGKTIPPRSLVLGAPGKVVRQLTDEDVARMSKGAGHYVAAGLAYARAGVVDPRR